LARLLKRSGSSWLITFRLVGRPGKLLRALRQEQAWVQKATLTAKGKKRPNAGKELRIDLEKVEVEEPGKPEQSMSAIRSGSGWAWTNSLLRLASVTRPAC